MVTTPKRIGPVSTNTLTPTVIYTVPASTRARLNIALIVNNQGTLFHVGVAVGGNNLLYATIDTTDNIDDSTVPFYLSGLLLVAGDTLSVYQAELGSPGCTIAVGLDEETDF